MAFSLPQLQRLPILLLIQLQKAQPQQATSSPPFLPPAEPPLSVRGV